MADSISDEQACSASGKRIPERLRWTPELVEQFWNGFAQTRLVEYSFSKQAGRSLLIAVDHLLPRDGRILDYGAGDGYLIQLMCERGLSVAGYEPSTERAQHLTALLGGHSGFLGIESSVSDRSFDCVLMIEVIEHILDEQLDGTLSRLAQAIRPGGLLIVTTPNNEDLDLGMAYCPVSNMLFHRWQHVRSFTDATLRELLARYGFEEVVTHQVEFNDALYVPYDALWGSYGGDSELPAHITAFRANAPTRLGGETNLLYIGKRAE